MAVSKIEQLIEDIYEFIESCKMQRFSTTQVIVPKDELYYLLDELRTQTPEEIRKYQKVITNRDAILADAHRKADQILTEAQKKTKLLVDENKITQEAYDQAHQIVTNASEQANQMVAEAQDLAAQIQSGAYGYTESMLSDMENVLTNAYNEAIDHYQGLIGSIKNNLDMVQKDRQELPGYDLEQELTKPENPPKDNFDVAQETLFDDVDLNDN